MFCIYKGFFTELLKSSQLSPQDCRKDFVTGRPSESQNFFLLGKNTKGSRTLTYFDYILWPGRRIHNSDMFKLPYSNKILLSQPGMFCIYKGFITELLKSGQFSPRGCCKDCVTELLLAWKKTLRAAEPLHTLTTFSNPGVEFIILTCLNFPTPTRSFSPA